MSDDRYDRQIRLPDIGAEGQRCLGASSVLVVGCGALGTVSTELLVRAGVGRVTVVDRDLVERSNLQRQTLFDERDAEIPTPKAVAAMAHLQRINMEVRIAGIVEDFNHRSAVRIFDEASPTVIVDGTDNFETRYLLNDLAVRRGVAFVYGGAVGTTGMSMSILPGETACLRCVFEEPPAPGAMPTCETAGVLGAVSTIVGSVQACETMKILIGRNDLVSRTLLEFDPWNGMRRRIDLSEARRDSCPCCGGRSFDFLDGRVASEAVRLCGQDAYQILPSEHAEVDLLAFMERAAGLGTFVSSDHLILGKLAPGLGAESITVFRDGRAVLHGVRDEAAARAAYARIVGS